MNGIALLLLANGILAATGPPSPFYGLPETKILGLVPGEWALEDKLLLFNEGRTLEVEDDLEFPTLVPPADWQPIFFHLNYPDDATAFHQDQARNQTAFKDRDSGYGLEEADVIYYAGHGSPTSWEASRFKCKVPIDTVSLGDHNPKYFFLNSCQVLAHGELRENSANELDYIAPGQFTGGALEANVFRTWGSYHGPLYGSGESSSAANPRLRMACGGTTRVDFELIPLFWQYKLIEAMPVADSFILSRYRPKIPYIGMCLARGQLDLTQLPLLIDADFSWEPNPASSIPANLSAIFVEYPEPKQPSPATADYFYASTSTEKLPSQLTQAIGRLRDLHVTPLKPRELPGPSWAKVSHGFYKLPNLLARDLIKVVFDINLPPEQSMDSTHIKWNPSSGALVIDSRSAEIAAIIKERIDGGLTIAALIQRYLTWSGNATNLGLERSFPTTAEFTLRLDWVRQPDIESSTFSVEMLDKANICQHLNGSEMVNLSIPGEPEAPLPSVEIDGIGARAALWVCPGTGNGWVGPPRWGLSLLTTKLTIAPMSEPALQPKGAYAAALHRLIAEGEDPSTWSLIAWRLAYYRAPLNCKQDPLNLVYTFEFAPAAVLGNLGHNFIEVPAFPVPFGESMSSTWECNPP